ncbi:MAG: hypothetical protein U5J64_11230 [Halobacteriales archaeon]|nr:hypothetical protein [Halobacteriales archaeon]
MSETYAKTGVFDRAEEHGANEQTKDRGKIDANRIAGSTRISLGYHREDGVRKDDGREAKKNPTSISAVGVLVGSTAFVLAGTALSTIPAAVL